MFRSGKSNFLTGIISIAIVVCGFLMISLAIIADWLRVEHELFIIFGIKQIILLIIGFQIVLLGISFYLIKTKQSFWSISRSKVLWVSSFSFFFIGLLICSIIFLISVVSLTVRYQEKFVAKVEENKAPVSRVSIPLCFDIMGNKKTVDISTDRVALVLMDAYDVEFEKEENLDCYYNLIDLLKQCRKHGVTIIHSPNTPAGAKYEEYKIVYKELRKHNQSYLFQYLSSRIGRQLAKKKNSFNGHLRGSLL